MTHCVSILSQPEGRELLFRPSTNLRSQKFQSSPSPKAGSYKEVDDIAERVRVSILSQPEGRELQIWLQPVM